MAQSGELQRALARIDVDLCDRLSRGPAREKARLPRSPPAAVGREHGVESQPGKRLHRGRSAREAAPHRRSIVGRATCGGGAHLFPWTRLQGDRAGAALSAQHRQDENVSRTPAAEGAADAERGGLRAMRLYPIDHPEHLCAADLLPWYVNGTLHPAEFAQVERHVATCIACKQDLAALSELQQLYEAERAHSRSVLSSLAHAPAPPSGAADA